MTNDDLENTGAFMEYYAYLGYTDIRPQFYDVLLQGKVARDDESVKMLDMIVDSRVFDFGYVYDAWKGVSFYPEYLLRTEKSKDFESYYAKKSKASVKHYDKILDFFANFEK